MLASNDSCPAERRSVRTRTVAVIVIGQGDSVGHGEGGGGNQGDSRKQLVSSKSGAVK